MEIYLFFYQGNFPLRSNRLKIVLANNINEYYKSLIVLRDYLIRTFLHRLVSIPSNFFNLLLLASNSSKFGK